MVILAHRCTLDEKEYILRKAREHVNSLQDTHPHHQIDQMGGDATPEHDPHWVCEDHVGQARMRHYFSTRRSEKVYGSLKITIKSKRLCRKNENLAAFLSWVTEAFRKSTKTDRESTEGKTLLVRHLSPGYFC